MNQPQISTGGIGAEPIRVCQIESQTKALAENARDLQQIVMELEKRLSPISRSLPEEPNIKQSVPAPVLVPLATELSEFVDTIRSSVDRLRELNGAIELP